MTRRPCRKVGRLEILRRLRSSGPGFLTLERFLARNVYAQGGRSRPYRVEILHRRGIDSVAIIPFFHDPRSGRLMVVIKIGFRPGLSLRGRLRPPQRDRRPYTWVREAVAGSLEPGDRGRRGIDARARIELFEETGLRPAPGASLDLGAGFFPSHGQSTEKVHLRAFRVDPSSAIEPPGDGSVNEGDSGSQAIEAVRLLEMCRRGTIEDPKLEIGVSRLVRRLQEDRDRRRGGRRRSSRL